MKSREREGIDAQDLQRGGAGTAASGAKKPYRPPELRSLGDVRDITLGGTFGAGDSTPINTQPF